MIVDLINPVRQRKGRNTLSLMQMLTLIVGLFLMMQLAFSYAHYRLTGMTSSLGNTTVLEQMHYPAVSLPIIGFICLQLLAYVFLIVWLNFIIMAYGNLFNLSQRGLYWRGLAIGVLACAGIIIANTYFYPHSFFAAQQLLVSRWPVGALLTWIILFAFFLLTGLAYIDFFIFNHVTRQGVIVLCVLVGTLFLYIWNVFTDHIYFYAPPPQQPNVIFIGLDSVRPDYIHYFNKAHGPTPTIDSFLQHSVVLTQSYTPLARTFPSWISILTSKYPLHSHARNNLVQADEVLVNDTLAKHLQTAGYLTLYASDEKRFSNILPGYGFDRVVGPRMGANDFLLGTLPDLPLTNLLVNLPFGRFLFPYNYGNRAAAITYEPNRFLQLLASNIPNQGKKPVFLAIHFCLSHWPYTWASDNVEGLTNEQLYEHGLTAVDGELAQTLMLLKRKGLLQHAVVVLLSDHGTALGLMGDRVISDDKLVGDKSALETITHYQMQNTLRYSTRPHDYTISTSFGQGTDVLSLQQYHTLLAFQGFGVDLKPREITTPTSLLNIAPTILEWLRLPSLTASDGIAMRTIFEPTRAADWSNAPQFWETGDKFGAIETDKIDVEKVLEARVSMYAVDAKTGLLFLRPVYENSLVDNKQRAIWWGDWMLVRFPRHIQMKMRPTGPGSKVLKSMPIDMPVQYVLVNLKTKKWGIGLQSTFAKQAPTALLYQKLLSFYANEIAS